MQQNETRTVPNTIYEDKLRIDYRPKYKTRNYKTLKGKHQAGYLMT